jgi:hypothetical protein
MTGEDILLQQDHLGYRNDIDALFSFTSTALADLIGTMQMKDMAVIRPKFEPFYKGFLALYYNTAKSKHMQDEKELIDEVDVWMDPRGKIDSDRVMKGKSLFMRWGNAMEKHGIHTLTK